VAHNPDGIFRQPLLALTHERQALLAARAGDASQAREHYEQARKVRAELLEVEPNNVSWRAALALTLAHCGQTADAATHAAEVAKQAPESVALLLQVARCYAACAAAAEADERRRFQELALEAARSATAGDFRDPVLLRTDPELAPLADLPQFAELLAQLKPALTPAP
jgi:predicted Zn-dependent protease